MRVLRGLFIMVLAALAIVPATAQGEVTISLAVNSFTADVFKDRIIPAFEAQNPGIKVHLVKLDTFGSPLSGTGADIEDYLDSAADYLTKADVVSVNSNMLRAITHADYLLDLSPLADTDMTLNADDFYPPALNALRWDGGLWGLPTNADVVQVFYDKQAFDNAGLAYPNGNWTVADYANAVRVLTELDASGAAAEVAVQLLGEGKNYLFATLAGDVLDDSVLPNVPDFSSPALYDIVDAWTQLTNEKYFSPAQAIVMAIGPDTAPQPLTVGPASYVMVGEQYSERIGTAPLPGNQSIVTASGYGVSGGTRHPEAAYALVKFLSSSPDVASLDFSGNPARRSVSPADSGSSGMRMARMGTLPASVQTSVNDALENGRPASELAFADSISTAINQVLSGTVSIEAALQQAEDGLLSDLAAADTRRASPLVVDAPPPPIVLAAGEIALNFAVVTNMTSLPNKAQWEQLAAEFTAQDPQVGAVILDSELPFGPNGNLDLNAKYDCYVTSNNPLTSGGTEGLFSLDPLLQSDMAFNPNDLYAGVLAQLQSGGQTWGIPVALSVEALSYDTALFTAAGVPLPTGGWTVADFELALRLLRDYTGEPAFVASPFNTTHLSTLIAAYGGIPYDTSTSPATVRYDDPASISAIQQVLDLALAGYITYEPFNGGRGDFDFNAIQSAPITTTSLGIGNGMSGGGMTFSIAIGGDWATPEDTRANAPYPTGLTLSGVSYSLTAGFISASTANIEPCYRWLSYVSQHPELFNSMPASRSQVAAPSLDVTVGTNLAAFYRGYGALLDNPTTRVISDIPLTFGTPATSYWLLKVMDDYVAAGGDFDLAAALTDAQAKASEYQTCTANVNQFDGRSATTMEDFRAMAQQMVSCAVSVDPSTASVFQ